MWQVRALEVGANEGVDDNGNRVCSLAGMPGSLVQLIKVEGDHLIIGEASYPQPAELAFSATWRHPRVRRWDQVSKGDLVLKDGAVPVVEATATEAGWIDLEDGVQVRFEGGDGRVYRSGDYWQIPARVATGAIEWPSAQGAADQPAFQRPFDIEHHYAPLGFLSWNQDGAFAQDCRRRLLPIDSCSRPRASTRLAMRRCWRSARRARLSRLPATRRRRATLPELRGVRRSDERAGGCGGAVADGAPDGLLQRGVCGHQP